MKRWLGAGVAISTAVGLSATAGTAPVDSLHALPILLKVLTYDRNFHSRGHGDFVVLVPCQPGKAGPCDDVIIMTRTLGLSMIQNRRLVFLSADLKDTSGLDEAVQKTHAQAILAITGTPPPSVKIISDVAQTNQIYTLALDPTMVEESLAIGVVAKEDGKPQILINIAAAKAVGAVFENAVLKLAKLVQ